MAKAAKKKAARKYRVTVDLVNIDLVKANSSAEQCRELRWSARTLDVLPRMKTFRAESDFEGAWGDRASGVRGCCKLMLGGLQ